MLDRIREMERRGDAQYQKGWARAWHVVRIDYAIVFNLLFLAIILSLVYLFASHGNRFPFDDSYVTLQFARNLLQFGRFTFDGGASSYGLTSPLHVLLIYVVSLTGLRPAWSSLLLGTALLGLAGIYTYYWSKQVLGSRRTAALAGLLLVTSGWMVFDAASGLETLLFIFLLMLALMLFEQESIWFGLPLALLAVTRSDAWFFIAGLVVYSAVRDLATWNLRRLTRAGIGFAVAAVVIAPLLIAFRNTGNSLLPARELSQAYFLGDVGASFSEKLRLIAHGLRLYYFELVMPLPFLAALGLLFARRFWSRWYVFVSSGLLYAAYLLVAPGGITHFWAGTQHLFLPFLMLAVAEGSIEMVRLAGLGMAPGRKRVLIVALVALLAANQVISLIQRRATYVRALDATDASVSGLAEFRPERPRFEEGASPQKPLVATTMPGLAAWLSNCRVLDLTARVNPDAMRLYRAPLTRQMVPLARRGVYGYLRVVNPDLLLIRDEDKRPLNFDPDRVPEEYRLQNRGKPVAPYGTHGYLLYRSLRSGS